MERQGERIQGVVASREAAIKRALARQPRLVPGDQITELLTRKYTGNFSFEDIYRKYPAQKVKTSGNPEKFDVAWAIIEQGEYGTKPGQDVRTIVRDFLEPGCKVTPELQILQDRLMVLLYQKGRIVEDSKEAKQAQESFRRIALTSEKIAQLTEVLPIGFMGALARIEFYKNVENTEERERLRELATKSFLRKYVGNFYYHKPEGVMDFRRVMDMIPEEVFDDTDKVTINLAKHYLVDQTLNFFIDGEDQGFNRLRQEVAGETSPAKREFLEETLREFELARKVEMPVVFQDSVIDEVTTNILGEEVRVGFPAFRQKYFAHKFFESRRKYLCGDTGATKTACAFLGMELLERERVTIFGPAGARDTWPEQAKKHFRSESELQVLRESGVEIPDTVKTPDVFIVEKTQQLDDPRILTARYVYISSELLSLATYQPRRIKSEMSEEEKQEVIRENGRLAERSSRLMQKLNDRVVVGRQTDGVILEESQDFRNPKANCSSVVKNLVLAIQSNYKPKHLLEGDEFPMIALTATPIFTDLGDFDVPLALLYPEKFAVPGSEGNGLFTFSSTCDRQPEVAFIKLFGEELLMRWTTQDMFGDRVPSLKFEDIEKISLEMTPEMKVLYDWMYDLEKVSSLNKFWLLRCLLINPAVIKDLNVLKGHAWYKSTKSKEELGQGLLRYYREFQDWIHNLNPRLEAQPFSADWIAYQPDGPEFLLECFFNDDLVYGFESLASSFKYMDIYIPKAPSPKAEYLRKKLLETFRRDEQGNFSSSVKTVVVSTDQTFGITRYLEDEDADFSINAFSIYEMVVSDWLNGIPTDLAKNVDGNLPFHKRRLIAKEFREDGSKYLLIILNQEAMEVSLDMAPRNTPSMQNIAEVHVIHLGRPWNWGKQRQIDGRFIRPGVGKPVRFSVLECEGTFDQGMDDLVRWTYLTSEVAMAGVKLDKADREFMDRSKAAKRIIEIAPNTDQQFIRNAIRFLRGMGEGEITNVLCQSLEGITHAQRWAEFYYAEGADAFRIVGNGAEFVKDILMKEGCTSIISVGAGTCLLNRKLIDSGFVGKIINVDINRNVLEIAQKMHPEIEEVVVGKASALDQPDGSVDGADYSYMLDMTRIFQDWRIGSFAAPQDTERVKVISEMNRVLKPGGKAVITLSESVLDEDSFVRFCNALEKHFGFSLKGELNGASYAIDTHPKRRLGWVITLEKVGMVNLQGINLNDLFFLTDDKMGISRYKGEKEIEAGRVIVPNPLFSSTNFEVYNPFTKSLAEVGEDLVSSKTDESQESHPDIGLSIETEKDDQTTPSNPEHILWEQLRQGMDLALGSRDKDLIRVIIDKLKDIMPVGNREWWKKTVRAIEHKLRLDKKKVVDIADTTLYEQAEIIAAAIYVESKFYLLEDINISQVQDMTRRKISQRFGNIS